VRQVKASWGERSLVAALFLTTAMLTGLAVAEDCFVDPPRTARSVKPVKRPTLPAIRKQPAPLAAPVVAAPDPAKIAPTPKAKSKPKPKPVASAAPTQARVQVDCPKDPAAPTAVLNESMSRPAPGQSSLLAAAMQAPVAIATTADTSPKSGGPGGLRGDDLALWPVAPVWQLARDNTAVLPFSAVQPAVQIDVLPAPLPPTNVPEPGTLSLLLAAIVLAVVKRVRP
jgi:hypothetical protein